jgi:endoglucanase
MSRRLRARSLAVALGIVVLCASAAIGNKPRAHAATSGCADRYPSTRNPANPLALASPPAAGNPLSGAGFLVDGPAHGYAAGAIARLLGIDASTPVGAPLPSFQDSDSWERFVDNTVAGSLLSASPSVVRQVTLLEKVASEPDANRFSSFSEGGTPSGLESFAAKLFCHNFTADPGTVPIINTDFLHATLGGCPSTAQINAYAPAFKRQVGAVVQGTGDRPVVYLLELDGLGSSACIARRGALPAWERLIRYEVDQFATLPHAVVYVEGGYSDANSPAYTARALKRVDVAKIQGFFTNDTHNQWTINEIRWGEKVSRMAGGAHFVVNTATNGNGPKLNPHPSTQGVEDLCNPPRRALGPRPTTDTGYPNADAFLWTHTPGISSGCGGGPPSGTFWLPKALGLAARANGRLGPHYPSKPY